MLTSCSAEKNNFVSRTYHNTTARFNPYFIANEHLKEVEATIEEQHDNNYNKILKVYPNIDTSMISGMKPQLEDAIKKSSKAIDWHKNSNMVEPSYILLGRSLFYLGEYEKSVTAYKIANKKILEKKDKSPGVRHEALIYLIRTYVDYNEHNNAIAVADFLRKENLNKKNKKLLYLNKAYLYQKRNELDSLVNNLVKAAPLMKKSEGQAKIYFIIGQVYQSLRFDAEAYNNYTRCLKSNPDYELSFYAKLNRAQVYELAKTTDLKKIRKFYKKLLKDAKNVDFKDKIYYDMAEFEAKQNHLDQAIEHYKSSVAASINNNRQKGYSFWRLGQIYYDNFKNFGLAKLYYDSTVQFMPKDEDIYATILQRQEVLEEFVSQLNTIHDQDSLLQLAAMDSVALSAYLDEVILKEEEEIARIQKEEDIRKEKAAKNFGNDFGKRNNAFTRQKDDAGNWYFYNVSAIGIGQAEFIRRWGRRTLEDNWRRSNKEKVLVARDNEKSTSQQEGVLDEKFREDPSAARLVKKTALYATIPFTSEAKATANQLIEDAYYKVGNIYNFNLVEKENALSAFDTLLIRFPETTYKPEVLYQMYLIYKDMENPRQEEYKKMIVEGFPNSIYAKIIINPNYQEDSKIASEKLKKVYKVAYQHFESGDFEGATTLINAAKLEVGENDFSDNMHLLEILIIGKTQDVYNFQFALSEFPKKYPESELNDYAKKLLDASRNLLAEVKSAEGVKFIEYFDQDHTFVLVYDFETMGENELPSRIEKFMQENYPDGNLNFGQLILTGAKSLIVVNQFKTKQEALTFFNLFNGDKNPLKGLNTLNFSNFVITKDNFEIFYQSKDVNNYMLFFEEHYN